MSAAAILFAAGLTLAAGVILWRVSRVLSHLSRRQFASAWTFDGFAMGYSLLGAATLGAVIDAWTDGGDWHAAAFVASSALLILFDRRSRRP